jgi:uncharacterized membrane protein
MNILLISIFIGFCVTLLYHSQKEESNINDKSDYKIKLSCVCVGVTFIIFAILSYIYSNKQELISRTEISSLGNQINNIKPPF